MNSLTLGRYLPYDSFVHRLDARDKIYCLIALMVAVFLPQTNYSMTFLMMGVMFVLLLVLLLSTHTSFLSLLKSLSGLWFMMIFLLVIYIFIPSSTHRYPDWIAFYLGSLPIYWDSLLEAAKIMVRLMQMIALTMVFTSSTKPLEMTDAFEWYLAPLSYIGFPSHEVAMIISIALRFIPTILEDTKRIMRAQASRGVDFEHGSIVTKVKAMVSLIVPLFVSSFVRSEDLADAMECRGYDPKKKRTKYRSMKFTYRDLIAFMITSAFLAFYIYSSVTGFDFFKFAFGMEVK